MFYNAGNVSASSGRAERVSKRRGHRHHNSAQGATSNEQVLPGRSKAHTPNAPSERVELNRTTTGRIPDKRKEEELLNETESIAEDLNTQYTVALTKYNCFDRLRAEAIGCLKAQQDARSEDLKEAQDRKVKDDLAWHAKCLREAHLEVVEQRQKGFGAGGNGRGKSEDAIDAFSSSVFLALTKKSSIFDSIEVLSILNHVVWALDKLRATYNRNDISKLKHEAEQLRKEHDQLRQQEQSNGKQDIQHRLKQHSLEVEKLHQRAKTIKHQELKDSRRQIERYNLYAVLDRQMTELEDLEKSSPEGK
ncbi:hypothetical protein ACEPAG_8852 [Sanghuangporus baumii]